ncbi:MAG: heavy-metal-associated domain-containing protein [Bacteroidota bacterium]
MKSLQISLLFFFLIGSVIPAFSQSKSKKVEKTSFEVTGVCNMCKARIENAALIKGVKLAEWDKKTQLLTVVFNNAKTTPQTIHKAVSDAGHDTKELKAPDQVYKKLPNCCSYRDGAEVH